MTEMFICLAKVTFEQMLYIPEYHAVYLEKNKANFTIGNGSFTNYQSSFKENICCGQERMLS